MFLTYFTWGRNPYISQNMGKVSSYTMQKNGKLRHSRIMGLLHISREAEIHTIFKTWEKWTPIVRKNYWKTQIFQRNGFLTYFPWNRSPCSSQNMRWVNSHSTGKVWKNTNIPKLWISYIFHVKKKSVQFPNCGMSEFPYYGKRMGKHRQSPRSALEI